MDNYQIARRAQIGVVIPSTNTGVEYDLQKFHLDGVTWHPSRFWIELRNWSDEVKATGEDSNTVFERFLEVMRGEIPIALRNVISAKVSHIMLGMSAETFWGGVEGSIQFEQGVARARCGSRRADQPDRHGVSLDTHGFGTAAKRADRPVARLVGNRCGRRSAG